MTKRSTEKKILRDSITGLKNPAIKRLADQAGIKSVSSEMYEDIRGKIKAFLEILLQKLTIYLEHAYKKILTVQDINTIMGGSYYHDGEEPKPKTKTKRSPRAAGGLQFQKAPFVKYMREILQDMNSPMKFAGEATTAIQELTENHIVKLLRGANIIANHSGRTTVMVKDLRVIDQVCV